MKEFSYLSTFQRITFQRCTAILSAIILFTTSILTTAPVSRAASSFAFVALSRYNCTMKIGQSFYLVGIASNGKRVTWKSSSSKIASVNTYGQVFAKKAGSCRITGKVSGGEASCTVTVLKTTITLSAKNLTIENGTTAALKGYTSNGSAITWKSRKSSVASVDENGRITANKPGEATITATADGSTSSCKVTVKKPKITLNRTKAALYRGQTLALTARTSSGRRVTWKSRKSSIAKVSGSGRVTAMKHGTARITASVDGVTKECEVTVKSPDIQLSHTSLTLKKGRTFVLKANVSSGHTPIWKSSKSRVATVDGNGKVTAKKKGTCTIYATEDGTREDCHIQVTA